MPVSSALLLAGILALSASLPHELFRYDLLHSLRRSDDTCRVCYGDECIIMDEARCEYYVEVDEVMDKPEENGEASEVDTMMSDLTEQAALSWSFPECLPLVSYYTDCQKENICVGCQACRCSEAGTWVCSLVQRCRPEAKIAEDHRTLVVVMEKLMENEQNTRKKRLVEIVKRPETEEDEMMDIANLMSGATPAPDVELLNFTAKDDENNIKISITTESSTQLSSNSDTPAENEYLSFEEVLKNIASEENKRRNSEFRVNNDKLNDYMDLEDIKVNFRNDTDQFMSVLNAIEEGRDVTNPTDATTFVVDLFPRLNKNNYDDVDVNLDTNNDIYNVYEEENNTIDPTNYRTEPDTANRKKRDVMSKPDSNITIQDTNFTTQITTSRFDTTTEKENDLINSVLLPLKKIIDQKQNEVKELQQIKDNLMHIMNTYSNSTELNITEDTERINSSTYLSIYKLDLFPKTHVNLRKNNLDILDKVLYKLKRDIYEVLKDIARIQKISNMHDFPDDLKMLMRSMKYYFKKQGGLQNFKKKDIQLETYNDNPRKSWAKPVEQTLSETVKRQLIDILKVLDEKTSHPNVLAHLSKSIKKILRRVIKQHFAEDFFAINLKIFDNEYNLTNDLRSVGRAWPQMTANLANSSPHDELYALKLFHFTLAIDINKLSDAKSLIDFAHSRRMSPIETPMAEKHMDKINTGLNSLRNKVQILIQNRAAHRKKTLKGNENITVKKESFLKRLRNMLRRSKKDIIDMAKKKIPKSEIFKTITKKNISPLSEKTISDHEQTMLKWQNKLKISRRKKRDLASHINTMKNRMKNIIPKYLRGKIHPAMVKQKKESDTKEKNKKKTKQMNHSDTTLKTKV